jgi:hypothetical protein
MRTIDPLDEAIALVNANCTVRFDTRAMVVTSRWPHVTQPVAASYHVPTANRGVHPHKETR